MQRRISPASAIEGAISLPGDKSISHRYAMLAAVAEGTTRIANYSTGADCHSTLGCVRALGIEVEGSGTEFAVTGTASTDCARRGRSGRRQLRFHHSHVLGILAASRSARAFSATSRSRAGPCSGS